MKDENNVRDPVCEMSVSAGSFDYKHLGMNYSFCSQQCHDRFVGNPHLYIGKPGKPSPKQQGKSIIKRRILKFDSNIPDEVSKELILVLNNMMGIKNVLVEKNVICISYDLLEATAEQIENTILETEKKLSASWLEKIKNAFIHYSEEMELDNLEHQESSDGHHC